MLWPSAEDRVVGPAFEENLAVIHTMFGEDNRAIGAPSAYALRLLVEPARNSQVETRTA